MRLNLNYWKNTHLQVPFWHIQAKGLPIWCVVLPRLKRPHFELDIGCIHHKRKRIPNVDHLQWRTGRSLQGCPTSKSKCLYFTLTNGFDFLAHPSNLAISPNFRMKHQSIESQTYRWCLSSNQWIKNLRKVPDSITVWLPAWWDLTSWAVHQFWEFPLVIL